MSQTLLQTKLYVPTLRPKLVPRPRLIERLDQGRQMGSGVTLICAPAGYGKTTLVTEWIQGKERAVNVAWISLDESDDDPARFFAYLSAALQRIGIEPGPAVTAMMQAPSVPPAEALMAAFINALATIETSVTLVLDDYHRIGDRSIHGAIAYLLEHRPPRLHLVLISREDPPISLARWRGRGAVVEIRQGDLGFTRQEATAFLNEAMGLQLAADEIGALERRTEGWIAGLQLAALALRGAATAEGLEGTRDFVKSFAGSNRFILDYLMEEVFRGQPPTIQMFLMQTSILDRLSGPLCAAVSGREESQMLLQQLEEANLFLIPLDDRRQWYRYHQLFADLLRFRAQQEGLELSPFHDRASRWYEANGFMSEAINHALLSEDWPRAVGLVERESGRLIGQGRISTLLRWLQALPDASVAERPALCENAAWALVLAGRLEAAEQYAALLEPAAGESPSLHGSLLTLKAFIARARHDVTTAIDLSQKALGVLPAGDTYTRSVLEANLGAAYLYRGHLDQAVATWQEAVGDGQQAGNYHVQAQALSFWGQTLAAQGKLHQAVDLLRQAIRLGTENGAPPITARARVNLAALLREWNDLEAAGRQVQQALGLSQMMGDKHLQRDAYRVLAGIRQAQGDADGALVAIRKAHQFVPDEGATPTTAMANGMSHVCIALAAADVAMAERWVERLEAMALPADVSWLGLLANAGCLAPQVGLVKARLLLAQGHRGEAAALLAREEAAAAAAGLGYSRIVARLLQALAAEDARGAIRLLTDALSRARPEAVVRVFLDEGEAMAALLPGVVRSDGPEKAYAERLLAAFRQQAHDRLATGAASPRPPEPLVEPLSERESQILELLARRQTNAEIAQALVVSANTVKTHLRHIYEKLGVHDRRAAVDRARQLGLIPAWRS